MQYGDASQLRFDDKQKKGHYESYFLRANHPTKKQALWLRYTVFSPANKHEKAIAELWGAFFNNDSAIAIQQDIALTECDFSNAKEHLKVSDSFLKLAHQGVGHAKGEVRDAINNMSWHFQYKGDQQVLPLLPEKYYQRALPKAKALVSLPNALFKGTIIVNGQSIEIDNWRGSENHNWGSQHTDEYAWGQVCGFDNNPDSFLECSTARVKLGPIWSPWLNLAVLRVGQEEYRFNGMWQAIKNSGHYQYFNWDMQCKNKDFTLKIAMHTDRQNVAGLNYRNPPGGSHTCLNSKVASVDVVLLKGQQVIHKLHSQYGGAFEILTDDESHGLVIQNILNKH